MNKAKLLGLVTERSEQKRVTIDVRPSEDVPDVQNLWLETLRLARGAAQADAVPALPKPEDKPTVN